MVILKKLEWGTQFLFPATVFHTCCQEEPSGAQFRCIAVLVHSWDR